MFTGIVSAIGDIVSVQPQITDNQDAGVRLIIRVADFLRPDTRLGDSIAIQGACMTVVDMSRQSSSAGANTGDQFTVDVSRESLNLTAGLDGEGPVNLEHAMRLGDTLDGHMVSGHVDGLGQVSHFVPVGESWNLRVQIPAHLAKYMAYKGSITVNGVSLTVNQVEDNDEGCQVSINLIPHTLQVTTLKHLKQGDSVNIEVDMIARYVERMMGLAQKAALADIC